MNRDNFIQNALSKVRQVAQGFGRTIQERGTPRRLQSAQYRSSQLRNTIDSGLQDATTSFGRSLGNTFRQGAPAAARVSPPGQLYQYAQGRVPNARQQVSDAAKALNLATTIGGGASIFRDGLFNAAKTLTPTAALGGAFSKVTGGSFSEGVGSGLAAAPSINAVTQFTNPAISSLSNKAAGRFTNPIAQQFAGRFASGVANLPEGAAINASLGRPEYGLGEAAFDFGTGFVMGKPQLANAKGFDFGRNAQSKWHPEDIQELDGLTDFVRRNKKLTQEQLQEADTKLTSLLRGYVSNNRIDELANKYKSDTRGFLLAGIRELQKSVKAAEDNGRVILGFADNAQKAKLRTRGRGSYTNVPEIDNPLLRAKKAAEEFEEELNAPKEFVDISADGGPKRYNNGRPKPQNPVQKVQQSFNEIITRWRGNTQAGRIKANAEVQKLESVPESEGFKVILFSQNPTKSEAKQLGIDPNQYKDAVDTIRNEFDAIRNEGIKRGLDIGYLENYINQVWKESPEEILAKIDEYELPRGASKTPSFIKERKIPTYKEGLAFGLTPQFTHPGQLLAHYRNQLEKAVANKQLIDTLVDNKIVVEPSIAPIGYKTIDAPLIPELNGMSAPKDVAEKLSNVFGSDPENFITKLVELGATASRTMQNITLSGGYKTLNAFTIGNIIKEFTAGRVLGPLKSFGRSFSPEKSKQYFKQNSDVMETMARNGVTPNSSINYEKVYNNIFESKTIKDRFLDIWGELVDKPTFERFLPMLEIEFYKDAVRSGMTEQEAAQATKNFYGVVDNFTRADWVENTLSTVFFAPRFRESMINFWKNNAKALGIEGFTKYGVPKLNPRNLTKKGFRANRRFIAGTFMTYFLMTAMNKAVTGHYMHENKEGKELALEIPKGGGRSFFIPMLPSIGTVPRRAMEAGGALIGGDVREASQKMGSFFSQPISLGSQLLTNRTFYGGPIYQDDDPAMAKLAKLVGYGAEQSSHPLVGEPLAMFQGRKDIPEAAAGLLELPMYASRSTSESKPKEAGLIAKLFGPKDIQAETPELPTDKATLTNLYTKGTRRINTINNELELLPYDTTKDEYEKQQRQKDLEEELQGLQQQIENISYRNPTLSKDLEYLTTAKMKVDEKTDYVMEEVTKIAQTTKDRGQMLQYLAEMRREVDGEKILSDGVIDNLYNDGLISSDEKKQLKNLEYDKDGNVKVKVSGRGRSAKIKALKISDSAAPKSIKLNTQSIFGGGSITGGSASLGLSTPQSFARIKAQSIV